MSILKAFFYKFLVCFICHFYFCAAFCQPCRIVTGKIIDSSKTPLPSTIISIKIVDKEFYALANSKGIFSIKICQAKDTVGKWAVQLSVSLIGYNKMDSSFSIYQTNTDLGEILLHQNDFQLKEVIVTNKPIEKYGDTTAFRVGAFQNKLDDNLEDVLKKMPGFDIDASGTIKYNNKPIENILIEGDELSKNYKSISRNITPDMIDKVEMIDKWSKNPILKNLDNSNKQTMNLTLKNPNHVSTFGKIKMGAGVENKANVTGNIFLLNTKLKTMGILNANNIGINPYSEIDNSEGYTQARDYEFDQTLSPAHIAENKLFSQSSFGGDPMNDLFNKSRMGLLNNSYNVTKKTNIKLFMDGYGDRISQFQTSSINNLLFPSFSYQQQTQKIFRPQNFNNNFQLINTTAKSRLMLSGVFTKKVYNELDSISSLSNLNSNLASTYTRLGTGAYFTQRLDSNRAFEISAQYIHDIKDQNYNIVNQPIRNLDSLYKTDMQNQVTNSTIDYLKTEGKLFFKHKHNRTNILSITDTYFNSEYLSNLTIQDSSKKMIQPKGYNNQNTIHNNRLVVNYQTGLKYHHFSFTADVGVALTNNNSYDYVSDITSKTASTFFVPRLNILFSPNNKNSINFSIVSNSDYPPLTVQNLHPSLVSYRSISSNLFLPNNVQNTNISINYAYTNLDKGTSILVAANRFALSKSLVQSIVFMPDFDFYTSRYINAPQRFDNLFTKFDKYFFNIKTSFSIKNTFAWTANPVEINGQVVSTKYFVYNSSFVLRPTINSNTNLSLGINYQNTKDLSSGNNTYQLNPFIDVLTTINKKLSIGTRFNYYHSNYYPDKKDYLFANINLWYNIVPKKLDMKLSLMNLFNTHQIYSGVKNGYLDKSTTTNTLPRFGILEVVYKF